MKTLLLSIACSLTSFLFAQERGLKALKIDVPIKIDGQLDESIWKEAAAAEDFILNSPKFGDPASQRSVVKVLYSDQAIYVGAYLYDEPSLIRKQLTSRDGEQRNDVDYFSVFFDTYNDDQNGFQFLVTSRNVQSDGRLLPNLNSQFGPPSDYSWDAVWESKVQIQKDGWTVEMKIPYSALRFSQKEIQDWGVNFQRYSRRNNESSFWNKIDPNQNGFVNQFGNLQDIKNIVPPLRLSFLPYVTAGTRIVPYANGKTKTEFLRNGGMDLKYGINESFTLDATLIPDFGQVISDNVVLNLSAFEVQFQENRPFFTEGIELFNKAGLFYSRRVGNTPAGYNAIRSMVNNNPNLNIISNPGITQLYNASKFSGRNKKKLGIGVFNAIGAPMHAVIEDKTTGKQTRIETEPLANYNIFVLDQALTNRSSITFTNANVWRSGGSRNSNVSSMDVNLFDKNNRTNFKWSGRFSHITGKENYNGFTNVLSYGKVSGRIQYLFQNVIESDRYDPNDLGFLQAPNEITATARLSYNQFTPTKKFLSYNYSLTLIPTYLYKPNAYSNFIIQTRAFWFFKNFWDLSINFNWQPDWQRDYFDLRTPGRMIRKTPYWYTGVSGSSDSRKKYFFRFNLGFAESPIPNDPFIVTGIGQRYRFNEHFSLDIETRRDRDNGQFGYAYRDTNGEPVAGRRKITNFTTLINGVYNFTPRMNLTLRTRHYWSQVQYVSFFDVTSDGWLTPRPFISSRDQNFNAFNMDMFYTWDFKYGSRFIIGWKNWLGTDFPISGTSHKSYVDNLRQVFQQPLGNEITFRLIYFIDYLTLQKKRKDI